MKRIALFVAGALALGGCVNHLQKPTNANGSFNPSVAVAEAEITYRNAAHDATAYVSNCRPNMQTIGCSEQLIQQLKVASDKAWKALEAAETAVKTLPAGGSALDKAIADMNAALVFLQNYTSQIPKK